MHSTIDPSSAVGSSPNKRLFKVGLALLLPLILILGLILGLSAASGARAATNIVVNTTADVVDSSGDCSLREAIQAANTDSAVDGCDAGSGDDTISFNLTGSGPYTITLAGTELVITTGVRINGLGADVLAVSGNNASRVFSITVDAPVALHGLKIVQGAATSGGGIHAISATLNLSDTRIADKMGAAHDEATAHQV